MEIEGKEGDDRENEPVHLESLTKEQQENQGNLSTIGPSPRTVLLDNPPIEFIGQNSDIIYWKTLRNNLLDNPPI